MLSHNDATRDYISTDRPLRAPRRARRRRPSDTVARPRRALAAILV